MAQDTGSVVWFNNAKGYGFLTYSGGPDVFCHFSVIEVEGFKMLCQGDVVEFDIVTGDQGRPQAAHVSKVGMPESYSSTKTMSDSSELS